MDSVIKEVLEAGGEVRLTTTGSSMKPLLVNKRTDVVLIKPDSRLKKYDIVLYCRDNGDYVLHRILKVRAHDYVICGDNQYKKEYGITDEMIIGVVNVIYRYGKKLDTNRIKYKLYMLLWCRCFYLRILYLKVKWIFKTRIRCLLITE